MAFDPDKALILWPAYFDLRVTRGEGRRVRKRDATDAPTAHMVYEAVKALRLDCILELEKAYPRFWYRASGRVLVEPKMKKADLIAKVASNLKSVPREKD